MLVGIGGVEDETGCPTKRIDRSIGCVTELYDYSVILVESDANNGRQAGNLQAQGLALGATGIDWVALDGPMDVRVMVLAGQQHTRSRERDDRCPGVVVSHIAVDACDSKVKSFILGQVRATF